MTRMAVNFSFLFLLISGLVFAWPSSSYALSLKLDPAKATKQCKNLLYFDFDSANDGPSYYTNLSGAIVANCGGCEMDVYNPELNCGPCPPPEWDCDDANVSTSSTTPNATGPTRILSVTSPTTTHDFGEVYTEPLDELPEEEH